MAARLDVLAEPHVFHVVVAGRVGRHEGLDVPVPLGPQRVDAEDLLELGPTDKPALPSIILGPVRSQQDPLLEHAALDRRERAGRPPFGLLRALALALGRGAPLLFRELRGRRLRRVERRPRHAPRLGALGVRHRHQVQLLQPGHVLDHVQPVLRLVGQRVALEVEAFQSTQLLQHLDVLVQVRQLVVARVELLEVLEFRERRVDEGRDAILGEIEAVQAKVLV